MPTARRMQVAAILVSIALSMGLFGARHVGDSVRVADPMAIAAGRLALPGYDRATGPGEPLPAHTIPSQGRPHLVVYGGLGTWIDIYDKAWRHPASSVREMRARGVRTLYLETSNFSRRDALVYPKAVRGFIDAAHLYGVAVVAWYLPGLRNLGLDYRRSMAAISLRTRQGNGFDSFAMDIESDAVRHPGRRTKRLLHLSQRIRAVVGEGYALGAIIPSPRRLQSDRAYWPRFPYRRLSQVYDVFLPMTYFTYTVKGRSGARWFTTGNIDIIRRETGDGSVPIHVIGGIGGDATRGETAGFVDALQRGHAIGGSYYTFPLTTRTDWSTLERLRSIG